MKTYYLKFALKDDATSWEVYTENGNTKVSYKIPFMQNHLRFQRTRKSDEMEHDV